MPNYRRPGIAGGTYFITQVTYQRQPWLCSDLARHALRTAITAVRKNHPFSIDAFVLLPDHFHCLWTLPPDDSDLSTRMRLVKAYVTRHYGADLEIDSEISASRQKRKERNLWQRRFWEHLIRDETDFENHCDYIHYNPVHHQYCERPTDWQFSSLHRFIEKQIYSPNWAYTNVGMVLDRGQYDI
jgi:putative transposase